jgi:hypothetical protein
VLEADYYGIEVRCMLCQLNDSRIEVGNMLPLMAEPMNPPPPKMAIFIG